MTGEPGDLDPPHPELPTQTPLIFTLRMGNVLYRHHQSALDPISSAPRKRTASMILIVLPDTPSASSTQRKRRTVLLSSRARSRPERPPFRAPISTPVPWHCWTWPKTFVSLIFSLRAVSRGLVQIADSSPVATR
jgi:hypothetical protein